MTPVDSRFALRRGFIKNRSSPLTFAFTAIADFSSLIGQEYVAGIMSACEHYGINFINMASAFRPSLFVDPGFFKSYLSKTQFMHAPLIDGLITWASSLSNYIEENEIQRLFSSLAPLPMVDIGYLDIPGVPSIRIDNEYSLRLLVEHLVRVHGFRKIAFLGARSASPHKTRLEMFKKEMAAFNLQVSGNMVFMADSLGEQDIEAKVGEIVSIYGMGKRLALDAIITASDIIAKTAISSLKKHDISVPEDVAVTGFNNQRESLTASSPVTTIDLAYFKRGYEAVELLVDRIMSPLEHFPAHLVPTSLVIRQSCGCFEESVINACDGSSFPLSSQSTAESEPELRSYLRAAFDKAFSAIASERQKELIQAVISDVHDTNVPPPEFTNITVVSQGAFVSPLFREAA